ncbi:hypothetical protein [Sorangium sp. So ce1389]|uniref:hypothetical protein n=1 Tax=Sorangium sp. So ce1389 TaxID=3133336 RepID=UPI003F605BFD
MSRPPSIRVPDAHVVHDLSRRDTAALTRRWERDLELLSSALARPPGDGRNVFYLGELTAGEAAPREALARRPGDAHVLSNLAVYTTAKER